MDKKKSVCGHADRGRWMGAHRMKLSRLFQPRNPRFWLMVVLNLLSTALAWVARSYDLVPLAALMVAGFAVANAVLGIRLALALMREEPPGAGGPRAPEKSTGPVSGACFISGKAFQRIRSSRATRRADSPPGRRWTRPADRAR